MIITEYITIRIIVFETLETNKTVIYEMAKLYMYIYIAYLYESKQ